MITEEQKESIIKMAITTKEGKLNLIKAFVNRFQSSQDYDFKQEIEGTKKFLEHPDGAQWLEASFDLIKEMQLK